MLLPRRAKSASPSPSPVGALGGASLAHALSSVWRLSLPPKRKTSCSYGSEKKTTLDNSGGIGAWRGSAEE